jgi:predicted Zn-dependent protease
VVFLGALAVVLLLGVLWGAGSVATERPGTPEPTRVVLVAPGDTLYDIAAAVTVDGDVNAMVERIQRLNRMESGMLVAGQEIRVPVTTG